MNFLSQPLFGTFTPLNIIAVSAALVVGSKLFFVLLRALKGKADPEHIFPMRCTSCGWSGKASRYARVCPSCNGRLKVDAQTS